MRLLSQPSGHIIRSITDDPGWPTGRDAPRQQGQCLVCARFFFVLGARDDKWLMKRQEGTMKAFGGSLLAFSGGDVVGRGGGPEVRRLLWAAQARL